MWTYNVGPQWAKYMLLTGNSIDGKTAAAVGLAMKAVPAGDLEDEAHDVARRMAMIDPALLAANKSICNKAIELMGRTLLQQLALEMDAVGHKAPAVQEFKPDCAGAGAQGRPLLAGRKVRKVACLSWRPPSEKFAVEYA